MTAMLVLVTVEQDPITRECVVALQEILDFGWLLFRGQQILVVPS